MQLIWCLLSNFYLNMFRASLCPSAGEQDRVLLHMVFCTVTIKHHSTHIYTTHYSTQRHYGSHILCFFPLLLQCRTPYAVECSLVLLKMGH